MAQLIRMIRNVLYGEGGLLEQQKAATEPLPRHLTFNEFLAESAKIIENHQRRRE